MAETFKNRRKTIVINPQEQKRLIMNMSLIPSLGLAATIAVVCFFCRKLYVEAVQLDIHLDNLIPLFLAVSGFVLVSGFFMISNALMISHRICGPAYRICKSIEQIRTGDVAFKVNLRKGDHLVEIRDELNLLLDALNENAPEGFQTREMRAAAEAAAGQETKAAPVDVDDVPAPVASAEPVSAGADED